MQDQESAMKATGRRAQTGGKKLKRREESEFSGVLKTRKLLIFRPAKNAVYDKIVPN
jgi:hypothetical protein